ncbi:MAG: hypothetical protein WCL39_13875, partial [Armatimonadota bacterium]
MSGVSDSSRVQFARNSMPKLIQNMQNIRFSALKLIQSAAIIGLLIQTLVCAEPPNVSVSGYVIWYHGGKTGEWNWQAPEFRDSVTSQPNGANSLRFSIPLKELKDIKPNARVGLFTGGLGQPVLKWLNLSESWVLPVADSPLTTVMFGPLWVKKVTVSRDFGIDSSNYKNLNLDIEFDAPVTFNSPWDLMVMIDSDGDSTTGYQGSDYILQ